MCFRSRRSNACNNRADDKGVCLFPDDCGDTAGNVPAYYSDRSVLFDTGPQAEAKQHEEKRVPSPDYRNPRSCYVFGIYYFMLFYSIKKTYKPKPAVSKYENRIVYTKSLIKSGFSFLLK